MPRRPAHKTGHPACPHPNWAACDEAAAHQWGKCKAVTGDRTPEPCTRWAVGDEGYCGQHYTSAVEKAKREERIAIAKAALDAKIDAYIEWRKTHPSVWDRIGDDVPVRKAKGPYRLTSLA